MLGAVSRGHGRSWRAWGSLEGSWHKLACLGQSQGGVAGAGLLVGLWLSSASNKCLCLLST